MKIVLLLSMMLSLFGTEVVHAQDSTFPGAAVPVAVPSASPLPKPDSVKPGVKAELKKRETFVRKYERRKFDSTLFTNNNAPTTSDYLDNLDTIYQMLSAVPGITASFIHLPEIQDQFDQEDSALTIIKSRLAVADDRSLNVRNLQMFNTLLDALDKNTGKYAKYLDGYDKKMDGVKADIAGLKKDTLMLRIFRDSALRDSFQVQLQQLKSKWRAADSLAKFYAGYINDLKARASSNSITINDLTFRVDTKLKEVGTRAFGKERRYLWEPRSPGVVRKNFSKDDFQQSIDSERQLTKYYFANSRSNRLWLLLTGLLFFFWIGYNFRSLRKLGRLEAIESFHFQYVKPWPFSAALIFMLSLAPLFDLHAPAIYIETIEFLLMVLLTLMFRKRLPRYLFYGWCIFILLFLSVPVIRILGLPVSMQRWADLIQNIFSVVVGVFFLFNPRKLSGLARFSWLKKPDKAILSSGPRGSAVASSPDLPGSVIASSPDAPGPAATAGMPRWSRIIFYAGGLYVFFNVLAVLCNLFGRVTLSQIFGATAIYAFAQTVSLLVFTQSVVEAFLLQIQSSRIRKSYPEQFDVESVSKSIQRFAIALAILLWLIVFTTNLNVFDTLNDLLAGFFNDPRQVGSFNFTIGEIALFLGIIWTANFLQKYITYFFGDTGDDAAFDDKGQRSRLLVTRLILLVGGFLLAVAASGLPVDRITVILGALGVGIGLGLQSIVNNFVSGIILIFDRPLRIGDTVEIGDKKGRVKEIGIRSSTLLTDEGAEVIIPNGDVLSHNIVNWTLSNNNVRVSLSFTIDKPPHPEDIGADEIKEIIKANPNVLERKEPEILLSNISSKSIQINVFFWSKDFNKTTAMAGDVRTKIYEHFEKKGITVE